MLPMLIESKDITSIVYPFCGAVLKVKVVPDNEYVDLSWYTPWIKTNVLFSSSILLDSVKAVALPLPVNWSATIVDRKEWYTIQA